MNYNKGYGIWNGDNLDNFQRGGNRGDYKSLNRSFGQEQTIANSLQSSSSRLNPGVNGDYQNNTFTSSLQAKQQVPQQIPQQTHQQEDRISAQGGVLDQRMLGGQLSQRQLNNVGQLMGSNTNHFTQQMSNQLNQPGNNSLNSSPSLNSLSPNFKRSSFDQSSQSSLNQSFSQPMNPAMTVSSQNTSHGSGVTSKMDLYKSGLSESKNNYDAEKFKLQLSLKNQIINNLKKKLESKSDNLNDTPRANDQFYKLYKELASKLEEKQKESEETNKILEALLVSLTMNSSSSSDFILANGRYDEQELTHKIVNKINYLQSENANLIKIMSLTNKLSLAVEIGLLKNEVSILKEKLAKYESPVV